jgi:hypothetical protein
MDFGQGSAVIAAAMISGNTSSVARPLRSIVA